MSRNGQPGTPFAGAARTTSSSPADGPVDRSAQPASAAMTRAKAGPVRAAGCAGHDRRRVTGAPEESGFLLQATELPRRGRGVPKVSNQGPIVAQRPTPRSLRPLDARRFGGEAASEMSGCYSTAGRRRPLRAASSNQLAGATGWPNAIRCPSGVRSVNSIIPQGFVARGVRTSAPLLRSSVCRAPMSSTVTYANQE